MSCLGCFPSRSSPEIVDVALNNTKFALDVLSGALSMAPIPGLDAAASGLSAILGKVIVSVNCT